MTNEPPTALVVSSSGITGPNLSAYLVSKG